jgi:hypothetical protein
MARNYAEELDTWVSQREGTGREKNLVAFHAVRDDIQTALAAGFAVKTIWAHMRAKGRISYGYNTFRFYVNRFIKKPQISQPGEMSNQHTQAGQPGRAMTQASVSPRTQPAKPQAVPISASPASAPVLSSAASSSVPPPPARRTGMPTFTFNPIPNPEDFK